MFAQPFSSNVNTCVATSAPTAAPTAAPTPVPTPAPTPACPVTCTLKHVALGRQHLFSNTNPTVTTSKTATVDGGWDHRVGNQCPTCHGDCDSDSECGPGLECHHEYDAGAGQWLQTHCTGSFPQGAKDFCAPPIGGHPNEAHG